ncbi:MAG: nicotinate-nucleotide adenylyltransferase [Gemmataceae bacterium]|nr:nicotinate-nucleotide adenylyltransferase [Gemmata sp.]MDW8197859.1 nicotinate-nucleotide adenylyltransferase [Gemmataceae bacterium]
MRIGIFGGTFDPVHVGHLIVAEQCRVQGHLDEVWFVPSAQPPHKPTVITRFEQRCDMLELAIAGHPAFRVNRIEKERAEPSYTAVTLEQLHLRHPGYEFSLVLGSDCLPDLPGWYEPQKVIALAELIVVPRPGGMLWTGERLARALHIAATQVRLRFVTCPMIDIASRELRRAVSDGWSIRYLVPRAVEEYIRERKLYVSGG